ncbi:carbon storage regulator [Steroidobacter sp. S1-65]|uniref:Translational regulator CsrA n=2 Tax=Steroidobacter gossypii TaxID=2805490 RepID=A0ABS1WXT2_9GAMM|nr:carbon storage regulator [Steroidobacter gossypii]
MLVLTRRIGEVIRVHRQIEVTVLEVRHGVVRLGWRAPSHVEIVRAELCRGSMRPASRAARRRGRSTRPPDDLGPRSQGQWR